METLSTTGIPAVQAPEAKPQVAVSAPVAAGLEPLPPPGTGKPSVVEIQKALKNAGYYNGPIDGKIGSMTNSAIKEFQQANGLEVDGKVGPKTWAVLGAYLAAQLREQAGQ
ncbi:MAG: peptidoglycan-binding protein [Candidatus Omnitrophica bacterium]|nr:peptidoglycan-binding protein [Candidatus Omnitrophota bacterium]MBU1870085.1 peptidoglycan-binding protein [Candidatus Omnitrophota bacterium]